jgi:hypothetical protein
MDADKSVTANYETITPTTHTLSVSSSGELGVPITSSTGHGGTTNYIKTVDEDTKVTLTAPATSGGKTFTGWTGAVTSSERTIEVSMDADKFVTTNYETATTTQMLTVTSPVNENHWVKGQTHDIRWKTTNPSSTVKIMLFKGNRKVKVIHKSAPNTGTFSWEIPARLPNRANYSIKVICTNDATVLGFSDTFEICRFGDLYTPIEVSDPNNNSVWYIGEDYPIQWTGGQGPEDGMGTEVKIELCKGRKVVKTISALTANDGQEMWTVPSNLRPGKNYRIKVRSADYSYVMNQSPAFSVAIPPINVTLPTSSTEWKPGNSYEIRWTGGKPNKPVSIMLMKAGRKVRTIVRTTATDRSFNWQVPSGLAPGSDYQVKVANGPSAALKDVSPTFSVVE